MKSIPDVPVTRSKSRVKLKQIIASYVTNGLQLIHHNILLEPEDTYHHKIIT